MKEVLPLVLRLLIREDMGGKGAQSGMLSPLLLVLWMHLGAGAVGESEQGMLSLRRDLWELRRAVAR